MIIKPDKTVLKRGGYVLVLTLVLWCVLAVRLFYLQIVSYDEYHAKVIDNITSQSTITASRGAIYDRNMTELAINRTLNRVFIAPDSIRDQEEKYLIARYLSELLDVDYDMILEKADKSWRKDETIKNFVDNETADRIRAFVEEYDLNCVYLQDQSQRYYPFSTLASQVIGFTDIDGVGLYGIELEYNDYLTGVAGKVITATNARGTSIPTKYGSYTDSVDGYSVVTTIDYKIQSILEKYVKMTFEENKAQNRTCGIVMDVKTGAVLGMATYPSFDLNDPRTLDSWSFEKLSGMNPNQGTYEETRLNLLMEMWNNKPITMLYEPGSTFKIITAAMGLEENVFQDTTLFECTEPFYVPLNDYGSTRVVNCWHFGGHGVVTFRRGLQQSCNPTLMQASWLIGSANFFKYIRAFGYTLKTDIDLPGESKGIFHTEADFRRLDLSTASFGQNFKTTPIQQLTAICTVANGGTLVTPHVVSALVDRDKNVVKNCTPEPKRVLLSQSTCATITDILTEGVSTDGAAKNAYVKGYKIAGKTGTSEKTDQKNEQGEVYLYVGSCVGYGPSDDPQVAILIICDEPQGESIYGSVVAAPYVSKAMSEILPYLNIDPVYSEDELKDMEVNVSGYVGMSVTDAIASLNQKGLRYVIHGDGPT
ncbi:MAG: hypothetical protein II719_00280, partial [Clostridia bacterium]|nr:hypothetical protein [Clostridia bacterium]